MGLTTTLKAAIGFRKTGAADLATSEAKYAGHSAIDLANGTGNNQADLVFSDTRTIGASGSETLDLTSGLTGPLGEALNFAKIKAILIKAAAGNTNSVVVGGAASDPFDGPLSVGGLVDDPGVPLLTIPPGGEVLLAAPKAGWATAGATDLKVANSGGTTGVTYDIVIVGTSA